MAQTLKEVKVNDMEATMYQVYVCETHGTMLTRCCETAEHIGWMEDRMNSNN